MKFFRKFLSLFQKKEVPVIIPKIDPVARCGHPMEGRSKKVVVFGFDEELAMLPGLSEVPLCFECAVERAVPCAWCGRAIFRGEQVMIISPREREFKPKAGSLLFTKDPMVAVGCWRCAGDPAVMSDAVLGDHRENLRMHAAFKDSAENPYTHVCFRVKG